MEDDIPVTMRPDDKVGHDVACKLFDDFTEAMDLELDEKHMEDDEVSQFRKQKKRLIDGLMRGSLDLNDDGEMTFKPENKKSTYQEIITFHERTGASVMAMDGRKKGDDVRKMYAVMADMCKIQVKDFAGMRGRDIKICEAICTLLMD